MGFQDLILVPGQQDPSVVNEGHAVSDLLQVAGNVGGHEDGALPVPDILHKQVQDLVPHHRIQSGGRLIHNQQLCMVGQGAGDLQLHFHALGKLPDLLFHRQLELLQIPAVGGIVPVRIQPRKDPCHILRGQHPVKGQFIKHHCQPLFDGLFLPDVIHAQQPDLPLVNVCDVQHAADGGGLSGTVLPDKAHNTALGHGKADMLQGEPVIPLSHVLY